MPEPINFNDIDTRLKDHFRDDLEFQRKMDERFARMEPMFQAFEENKITKMVFDKKTKTLYIRSKEIITIVGALALIYSIIKNIIPKFFH